MKIIPDKSAVFQILTKPLEYENQNADLIHWPAGITGAVLIPA